MDLAAKKIPRTVELAPAVMRDYVQRPAVLGLGWWQVAAAAEMTGSEAASAMAEAVAVMVVAAAAVEMARLCIMEAVHSQRGQGAHKSQSRPLAILSKSSGSYR